MLKDTMNKLVGTTNEISHAAMEKSLTAAKSVIGKLPEVTVYASQVVNEINNQLAEQNYGIGNFNIHLKLGVFELDLNVAQIGEAAIADVKSILSKDDDPEKLLQE